MTKINFLDALSNILNEVSEDKNSATYKKFIAELESFLSNINTAFKSKEPFTVLESTKAANDIYMPVNGVIIEINNEYAESVINTDPLHTGWIVKIKYDKILCVFSIKFNICKS